MEKQLKQRFWCWLIGFVIIECPIYQTMGAEKIRLATAGLSASSSAIWATHETKAFQKHGLEV